MAILDRYVPAVLQKLLPNGGWSKADCDEHAVDVRIQDRQPSPSIRLDERRRFYEGFRGFLLAWVPYLVWCLQRFFTFGDFVHDRLNGGAPDKDFGVLVLNADVLPDCLDQLRNIFERAPTDPFVDDLSKPAFHHIEPGTGRWNELQMKPWVTF